jgi:hypothetical protein
MLSGCDDATTKLKQSSAELAEAGKTKIQEVKWDVLFAEFESAGLNIKELAGLYAGKHWDEAKLWIGKIDSQPTKAVFLTIGEVLYLEEIEGVEGCKTKITELLKDKDITPARKKTLEIMQTYVGGKHGAKTSDIAVMIGLVYLHYYGLDIAVNAHGTDYQIDMMLFLAAVEHARKLLHVKPDEREVRIEELMKKARDQTATDLK